VTLNITAFAWNRLYHSSDVRVSYVGSYKEPEEWPKVVMVIGRGWNAILGYNGLAQLTNTTTQRWLVELAANFDDTSTAGFDELLETIRDRGSKAVRQRPVEHRRLTVVVAAYVSDVPLIAYVSNYEVVAGAGPTHTLDELRVTRVRPRGPSIYLAGRRNAVTQLELKKLRYSLRKRDPDAVMASIASVNKTASRRDSAISAACLVALNSLGGQTQRRFGSVNSDFIPESAMWGINIGGRIRDLLSGGHLESSWRVLRDCEIASPSGTWSSAASLCKARRGHTATLLADGHVLVAGGGDEIHRPVKQCELYDVRDNSWCLSAPLNLARLGHQAVRLKDGRVLVCGGDNDAAHVCEVFNEVEGTWTRVGALRDGRTNHTLTALSDGSVLAVGGTSPHGGVIRSIERWNPDSERWSVVCDLRVPRYHHAAVLLASGRVAILGGNKGTNPEPVLRHIEVVDVNTGESESRKPLIHPRALAIVAALPISLILVAGNGVAESELVDVTTRVRALGGPRMSQSRFGYYAFCQLADGSIVVTGGQEVGTGRPLAHTECFSPVQREWTPFGDMQLPRVGHAAVTLADGRVLVSGGTTNRCIVEAVSEGVG
jgi:Galactose oxidase, central domain/Kelch motif